MAIGHTHPSKRFLPDDCTTWCMSVDAAVRLILSSSAWVQ